MKHYLLILLFCVSAYANGFALPTSGSCNEVFLGVDFATPDKLEQWIVQNLQANGEFRLEMVDSNTDIAGNKHFRYRQYYHGMPVEGSMVHLHCKGRDPQSINGTFFPSLSLDSIDLLSEEEALQVAQKSFPAKSNFSWESAAKPFLREYGFLESDDVYAEPKPSFCIVPEIEAGKTIEFRLTYVFPICAINPFEYKQVFVDAGSGSVLQTKSLLFEKDKKGVAHTKYSGVREIICDSILASQYKLIERTRGLDSIFVLSILEPAPYWLYDDDNVWNNVNALKDEVATDLHWGLEMTYDYFRTKFSRNSYDGKGHSLSGMIHAGRKENLAYWNAAYGRVVVGDGDDIMADAWTSIDIVGHEFTHGLIQSTADLYYEKESGALNESFSDIFGKCVEYYALRDSFTWDLAGAIMLNGHQSIRSFNDPNSRSHPKYYRGRYYDDTTNTDAYGVHTNSSVQNYWFYLLCEGGVGLREMDSKAFYVRPIGMDTAAMIAYYTLVNYLTPKSQFIDAATYSIAAAKLLFGDSSHVVQEVVSAWYGVGVLNTLSIQEADSKIDRGLIQVFPNPTRDILHVNLAREVDELQLALYDRTGKKLLIDHESLQRSSYRFDLSGLVSGWYLLEIVVSGERQTFKIRKD